MRKMGISGLVLVCLLAAAPVMAVEGADAGSWWDGVVGWVTGVVEWVTQDLGPNVEPDGTTAPAVLDFDEGEIGGSMEPNSLGGDNSETGPNLEPNG
jgi:hypothetical protein